MRIEFAAFLLLAVVTCCTPRLLPPGSYTEQARSGIILLAGSTLTIKPAATFGYAHWSDDLSSSRYGSGTYQLLGHRLQLQFGESPLVVAQAEAAQLALGSDSLVITFTVLGPAPGGQAGWAPVPAVVVTGRTANGHVLAATASTAAGRARLAFAPAARPALLQAECLGLVTWQQPCPLTSTAFRVSLPPTQGMPYAPGTVKEFRVHRLAARHLVLSQGRHKVSLTRQPTEQ